MAVAHHTAEAIAITIVACCVGQEEKGTDGEASVSINDLGVVGFLLSSKEKVAG